jgi:hypothetical protein
MPIHPAARRSGVQIGISGAVLRKRPEWNSPGCKIAIMTSERRIKFPPIRKPHQGILSMVITAAHIQPIVALIAGILILLMPRFLNFVIAIYLIFVGLQGLGVFKMVHF